MKTFFKYLFFIIGIILFAMNVMAFGFGMMFGAHDEGPQPWTRRIHYVAPTYALGYWLTVPHEESEQ